MTKLSPATEARLLDEQADLLEAQADARYERAARWYRGGSYTFVKSLDRADGYRKEAKELRAQAARLRSQGGRPGDTTKG